MSFLTCKLFCTDVIGCSPICIVELWSYKCLCMFLRPQLFSSASVPQFLLPFLSLPSLQLPTETAPSFQLLTKLVRWVQQRTPILSQLQQQGSAQLDGSENCQIVRSSFLQPRQAVVSLSYLLATSDNIYTFICNKNISCDYPLKLIVLEKICVLFICICAICVTSNQLFLQVLILTI